MGCDAAIDWTAVRAERLARKQIADHEGYDETDRRKQQYHPGGEASCSSILALMVAAVDLRVLLLLKHFCIADGVKRRGR